MVGSRRRICLATLAVVLAPLVAAAPASLTLLNPVQPWSPGHSYTFAGTVTNNTGVNLNASDLFLNFNNFNPAFVTPVQLLGTPDFAIPDGTTSPVVDLFSLLLDPSTPIGPYSADVSLGEPSGFVTDPTTVIVGVPEPNSLALLLGGGIFVFARFRRARG